MKDEQLLALAGIVGAYYWWHATGRTMPRGKVSTSTGRRGKKQTTPSTVGIGANKVPMTTRQSIQLTAAQGGTGTGFVSAPVRSIGSLNGQARRAGVGSVRKATRASSTWFGIGSGLVSPSLPTTRVTSTRSIRIAKGGVQVPSYTSVPVVTRGPGGGGSVLFLGDQ